MAKDGSTVRFLKYTCIYYLNKKSSDIQNNSICHRWCYVTLQHSSNVSFMRHCH